MPAMISVVGTSNVGKTTLIEKLIPELKKRGYRIGVVKHAHHGFDIDQKGKDSWRHKAAGADTAMVASHGKIAMIKDDPCEGLDCLEKYFEDMDLVITEGYKKANKAAVEVFRSAAHQTPLYTKSDAHPLIAVMSDTPVDLGVPNFNINAVPTLADLIEKQFLAR